MGRGEVKEGYAISRGLSRIVALTVCTALCVVAPAALASRPVTLTNHLVDGDVGLEFPQNKQNEPAITRDPSTGVLVAGANDELGQPLCPGTTAPLAQRRGP